MEVLIPRPIPPNSLNLLPSWNIKNSKFKATVRRISKK